MKIQKLIVILIVCLLTIQIASGFTVFADEISVPTIGEQPSDLHEPPILSEEPKSPKGQLWEENDSPLEEKDDSNLWLYVGIGVGVVAVAVGAVFVVKAIKDKRKTTYKW